MGIRYIKRDLEAVVEIATREYPVLLVTGQRQVGKTTMLTQMMEGQNRGYVTLDDLIERELAKRDPEMFFQLHKPPVLIDEVQYAPELFPYIKLLADRAREPGMFWLTLSQTFHLMKLAGESLAGRACILQMTTLSQHEIYGSGASKPFTLTLDNLQERKASYTSADTPQMYERIFRGSMPALVSGRSSNANLFYSSYLQTYIERDVRELAGDVDALEFIRFIRAVACRCSQMLNVADIGQDVDGLRGEKTKAWLGILERSGIIFYLHPYSNNLLKRTVKAPKVYFYDTGLVAYLTKWMSGETLEAGAMSGAILENYTVAEIVKSYLNAGMQANLNYYRDKDAREIDVVLEADGMLYPIEIKKTAKPDAKIANAFKLLDKGSVQRGQGAILCMRGELTAIDNQNLIVPIWMI